MDGLEDYGGRFGSSSRVEGRGRGTRPDNEGRDVGAAGSVTAIPRVR